MTFALLVLLSASESPNPYLMQAKVLHQGLEFEKCLKRLEQANRWQNSRAQLAEIELYSGLCQAGLGQEREATEHFDMGLKLDPKLALPPLVGPKVAALFQKAQSKVRPGVAPEAAPEPAPPVAKPPPAVVPAPVPPPSVVVQQPPPPQKRQLHLAAPLALAGISALSAVIAGVFGFQAHSLEQQANAAVFESDGFSLGAQAKIDALAANGLWAFAGAALIAAVIVFIVVN